MLCPNSCEGEDDGNAAWPGGSRSIGEPSPAERGFPGGTGLLPAGPVPVPEPGNGTDRNERVEGGR